VPGRPRRRRNKNAAGTGRVQRRLKDPAVLAVLKIALDCSWTCAELARVLGVAKGSAHGLLKRFALAHPKEDHHGQD
jgi:hypothetical protein